MICETLLRQREDSIREEYDKVLHEKLQGFIMQFYAVIMQFHVVLRSSYNFIQNNTRSGADTTKINYSSISRVRVQITFRKLNSLEDIYLVAYTAARYHSPCSIDIHTAHMKSQNLLILSPMSQSCLICYSVPDTCSSLTLHERSCSFS